MERKSYSFKAALAGNTISGGPAVIGNMDLGNDVIFPNSFKGVLGDFLKNGFVAIGHEWDDLPIAYPTLAKEVGRQLYSEATFHSTQAAQDAKAVAKERLDAGLNVGLSIGFKCTMDGLKFFDSGEMLLLWAKEKGYDLSLFDQKSILACDTWCRGITQFDALYEWSIVAAPMNPEAMVSGVKGIWTPDQAKELAWRPDIDEKAASGSTSLPIAARDHAWDGPAAEKRVRAWADAADGPNSKYRSAFFWYDSANADQWGSYHLGFADVINGTLTAIPRGVFACAGALQGARGADGAKYADAKPKIESYYARFRKEFNDDSIVVPWDGKSADVEDPDVPVEWRAKLDSVVDIRTAEDFLRDAGGLSRKQSTAFLSVLKPLLRDAASETPEPAPSPEPPAADPVDPSIDTKASEKPAPPADPTPPPAPSAPVTPSDDTPPALLRKRQELAAREYQRFLAITPGRFTTAANGRAAGRS